MKNGFVKIAAATPRIRVADPRHNAEELLRLARAAEKNGARVILFPELCLSGATCGDLFWSDTLLSGVHAALNTYLDATREMKILSVIGLPVSRGGKLYNAAAFVQGGDLLGIVAQALPNARGGLELGRYFASDAPASATLLWDAREVPFGTSLLFVADTLPTLSITAEIGTDLFLPLSPAAATGATLICHPCAMAETVSLGRTCDRMIGAASVRLQAAYVSATAGAGESTTDAVFGGRLQITEIGQPLAFAKAFDRVELLYSELDLEKIAFERRRNQFSAPSDAHRIPFSCPPEETALTRPIDPHPFLPADPRECARRCEEILSMQSAGLEARIERAYAKKIVVGISGGLDSTLALLVMVRAMDALERPRRDIIAVTMPCFGTTVRTKTNATVLCEELGVDFRCVDIFDAVKQHFSDIGHDPEKHDVTYENAQARERTQVLMDIANACGGMVIGTGDLSELALGWATYNGDHMSMYGVNADLPKTLIRHVVAHCADTYAQTLPKVANALRDILDTPVSPELLPAKEDGSIAQKTEDLVGPYELHDFYLYYFLRYEYTPQKLYRMARHALGDRYDDATLKKWLTVFLRRFFSQQFKRSCLPDGPRVGSVALSPRGAWCMPSDAASNLWLEELES